jgi:lipoprotein signal peptidase
VLDFIRVSFLPGIFNVSDLLVNIGMVVSLAAVFFHPEEEATEIEEPVMIDPERALEEELIQ